MREASPEDRAIVQKLFERRLFTPDERARMSELYKFGALFADQILRLTPSGELQTKAVFKIKEALAHCETAVAMNPATGDQPELALRANVDARCGTDSPGRRADMAETMRNVSEMLRQAARELGR